MSRSLQSNFGKFDIVDVEGEEDFQLQSPPTELDAEDCSNTLFDAISNRKTVQPSIKRLKNVSLATIRKACKSQNFEQNFQESDDQGDVESYPSIL